jgi:hypothetical protein
MDRFIMGTGTVLEHSAILQLYPEKLVVFIQGLTC